MHPHGTFNRLFEMNVGNCPFFADFMRRIFPPETVLYSQIDPS